jgi:hypothetical protein
MPEAAVHKNGYPAGRKDNVGLATQAAVFPKPQTKTP